MEELQDEINSLKLENEMLKSKIESMEDEMRDIKYIVKDY